MLSDGCDGDGGDGDPCDVADRALVLNPTSGSADHADEVRRLATDRGFSVHETERPGDAVELAARVADAGATLVAAAGGDGTLNEAVRGLSRADALDRVTFAAVPAGTGNSFADNIGVESVEHAFEVVERDRRRRVDLGFAGVDGGEPLPFLNSCVGGITAEASARTTAESKARYGVTAYVFATLETAARFDPLSLHADIEGPEGHSVWDGEAVCILVGNGRRFPGEASAQADMEDGLFEVTIVESIPTANMTFDVVRGWLTGRPPDHVTRLKAAALTLELTGDPDEFSLDGEFVSGTRLDAAVRPAALDLLVGDGYDPHPPD